MRKHVSDLPVEPLRPIRLDEAIARGHGRDGIQRDVVAGRLIRPFRGVYACPGAQGDAAVLRAARAHLGEESVAILRSAILMHALDGVPSGAIPQLALPPGLEKRQRPGMDIHFWSLNTTDLTIVDGCPVTTVPRTLADVCRLLPRYQAVACVDSALHHRLISLDDLPQIASLMRRRRGCVTGRRVLAQARVGAQSPLETRVRLRANDGGLPPDVLQVSVTAESGAILGYADMGYALRTGGWLLVEADGRSVHDRPEAVLHDRHRQNAILAEEGNVILRFTWEDTRHAHVIPAILRPPLTRAHWAPGRARP